MSEIVFHDAEMLHLLWTVPAVAVLYFYASYRRRRALEKFARAGMLALLVGPPAKADRTFRMLACCLALALGIIALARPAWNIRPRQLRRTGRDIVFVLDVSRSMSARDAVPSRLQRAKTAVLDCLQHLQGDRVALVAFAGEAEVRCPLTLDYAFFRMTLEDTDYLSVARGGTRIADAIDTTLKDVLTGGKSGYRDIILITDGEDHDSSPSQAAARLADAGARLIAIGVGDDTRGRRIPVSGAFMIHDDKEVWTRLEARTLKEMVSRTPDGVYCHAATGAIDLPGIYRRVIASARAREFESQTILQYEEKFQIFLGGGLLALFAALAVGPKRPPRPLRRGALLVIAAAVLLSGGRTALADLPGADKAYRSGDYDTAADAYREALTGGAESPAVLYNMGNAMYRSGRYSDAREAYEQAAFLAGDDTLRSNCLYNLGNCLFRIARASKVKDPQLALQFYRISSHSYRATLDLAPKSRKAAFNMELARRAAKMLADELQADRDKLEKRLEEIRKLLIELIKRQVATEAVCRKLLPATTKPAHAAEQEDHAAQARRIAALIQTAAADVPKLPEFMQDGPDSKDLGFHAARRHVLWAAGAQDRAAASLRKAFPAAALPDQQKAVEELKRALAALPSDPGKDQRSDPDGDPDKSRDGDSDKTQKSDKGDRRADQVKLSDKAPDGEEFTAPLETPEDILAGEKRNNMQRARKRPANTKQADKDW